MRSQSWLVPLGPFVKSQYKNAQCNTNNKIIKFDCACLSFFFNTLALMKCNLLKVPSDQRLEEPCNFISIMQLRDQGLISSLNSSPWPNICSCFASYHLLIRPALGFLNKKCFKWFCMFRWMNVLGFCTAHLHAWMNKNSAGSTSHPWLSCRDADNSARIAPVNLSNVR